MVSKAGGDTHKSNILLWFIVKISVVTVPECSFKMHMDLGRWNAVKRQRQDSDLPQSLQSGTVKTIGVNQIRFHYYI